MIEFNTAGNCIMKGHCGKSIVSGECIIEKLQIREVSSHFRNGWIFLVVKPVPLGKNEFLNNQTDIDPSLVEPLIIDNQHIKAKNLTGKKKMNAAKNQQNNNNNTNTAQGKREMSAREMNNREPSSIMKNYLS